MLHNRPDESRLSRYESTFTIWSTWDYNNNFWDPPSSWSEARTGSGMASIAMLPRFASDKRQFPVRLANLG